MKRDTTFTYDTSSTDFHGRRVAIVGGTGGIGRAFARALAAKGAQVTVVGRSFKDAGVAGIDFLQADLSSMAEAKRIGDTLPAEYLDLVIFTTGIMAGPTRIETADGIEQDMAISYLSRLVILRGIARGLERAGRSDRPRVFVVGYPGSGQKAKVEDLNSEAKYARMAAHMNTVAGNEALVLDAAERYPGFDPFGLNPGFVKTDIRGNLFGGKNWLYRTIEGLSGAFTKDADTYAARILPLFAAPELSGQSGRMFDDKGRAILPSDWLDKPSRDRLIAASETLVAAKSGVILTDSH